MDELLVKQFTRQLKLLNFWITLFGTLLLISLVIIGILVYKIVTFVNDTSHKISNIEQKTSQTLNVQKKICDTGGVGSLLKKETNTCD